MENIGIIARQNTAAIPTRRSGQEPKAEQQTKLHKTENLPGSTSAYSKARISRSRSSAKQDIESWATDSGMKGHVHLLQNSGFLVSNLVEDRALECKLWDLARERNAYLRFQERERALFLERLKSRSGGVLSELVSYIEMGKKPPRRITRPNPRPVTAPSATRSTFRSATSAVSHRHPLRPVTADPSLPLVKEETPALPSSASEFGSSSISTSSSQAAHKENNDVEISEQRPRRAGLSKSAQPTLRNIPKSTDTLIPDSIDDTPTLESIEDTPTHKSTQVQGEDQRKTLRPNTGYRRPTTAAMRPIAATVKHSTPASDPSGIQHRLSLNYPGRRFFPVKLESQGFKSAHATPASTLIFLGSTGPVSALSLVTTHTNNDDMSKDCEITGLTSRPLCFSEDDKIARTVEYDAVTGLIDGLDSLRTPSSHLRRNRLRSATAELVLREILG